MKLAEDMVARGSFNTLNNQLLQNQDQLNTNNLRRMAHVSPSITVHGNDSSYGSCITVDRQNSALGLGNLDITYNDFNSAGMSDAVSSVTNIW